VDAELQSWRDESPDAETAEMLTKTMRDNWHAMSEDDDALTSEPTALPTVRRSWWIKSSVIVATAASIALLVTWISQPHTVYAQALAAIKAARSVHAVAQRFDETGAPKEGTAEIWYVPGRGVREQEKNLAGKKSVRIDDGTHQWIYREQHQTLVKGPSRDPIGEIREMLEPLREMERRGATRDGSLDVEIQSSPCRAHVFHYETNKSTLRMIAWIDDGARLLRFEEQLQRDGVWVVDERIDLSYDEPIEASLFVANFPDARLIDRTAPLAEFTLESSLVDAERLGIIVSIREVRRVEEDMIYVMWTSYASDDVIRRFGKFDSEHHGHSVHGNVSWSTNGRRLPDHSWQSGVAPIRIAQWKHDGVEYNWTLLSNASQMLREDGRLPVGFRVHTRGKWQKHRQAAGDPWHSNELDMLELQVPDHAESLDEVLNDAYDEILTMGDGTYRDSPKLHMGHRQQTEKEIKEDIDRGMSEREARGLLVRLTGFTFNTRLDQWQATVKERIAER